MTETVRARGRPRDPAVRAAILRAAAALLDQGGLTAVTIEAVARQAGVGKPTIYRHWPNAHAVAMAAFLERAGAAPAALAEASGEESPLGMLRRQLRNLAAAFSARDGRNLKAMIAAAERETELAKAFRTHFIAKSREEGRGLLARAVADGSLRPDIDPEVTLDLVYGPLYYRLLTGHASLDGAFTDQVLDHVLRGLYLPQEGMAIQVS
jgi:AcrR family transcriptional regulator